MLRFGICTQGQYLRTGDRRRYSGSRVSYSLLDVGEHPTAEQIQVFEDICFTLRTSNGTFRTSFRQRFRDLDAAAMRWITRFYPSDTQLRVQDRAASHALTSWEWAEHLLPVFPRAGLEASDLLLYLVKVSLPTGETYIVEPDGRPLQYVNPPFVISVHHPEPWRYPLNHVISAWAKRRFKRLKILQKWPREWPEQSTGPSNGNEYQLTKIPLIHPEALAFKKRFPAFEFRVRSIFDATPAACHVLRTMNILNKAYFSAEQLTAGVNAAFQSIKPDGIWIIGRTAEDDFSNHVTLFRRREDRWEVLERIGTGSDIEDLALQTTFQTRESTGAP